MVSKKAEKIALFRYGVIFPLLDERLSRGEKSRILDDLCSREYEIPYSRRRHIARSTIKGWVRDYSAPDKGGIESLAPRRRSDMGESRALSEEEVRTLTDYRKCHPGMPTTTLVKKAITDGELPIEVCSSMASVYRLMKRKDASQAKGEDLRRFEMENCNDMWMLDAMVGPEVIFEENGKTKFIKAHCFAFIDDRSRYITYAEFYPDEKTESLLDCMWKAFARSGLPRCIFTDNGPAMRDTRLALGLAELEVRLSFARPYKGSSKAKIERFWRTMRDQFIPLLPQDGLTLRELNSLLNVYIREYNTRYHSGIGCSPAERYTNELQCVRVAPRDLPPLFRKREIRTVSKARTVSLENKLFEVPLGYAGKKLELRYFDLSGQIEAFYEGKSIGYLSEVNLVANSNAHRCKKEVANG